MIGRDCGSPNTKGYYDTAWVLGYLQPIGCVYPKFGGAIVRPLRTLEGRCSV